MFIIVVLVEEDDDDDDLFGDDFGKYIVDDDVCDGGEWDDTGDESERTALVEFDFFLFLM